MPFNFVDILILRYLKGNASANQTLEDFNKINEKSDLNLAFASQMTKFIKRFWKEPYREEDRKWIDKLIKDNKVSAKKKFIELRKIL